MKCEVDRDACAATAMAFDPPRGTHLDRGQLYQELVRTCARTGSRPNWNLAHEIAHRRHLDAARRRFIGARGKNPVPVVFVEFEKTMAAPVHPARPEVPPAGLLAKLLAALTGPERSAVEAVWLRGRTLRAAGAERGVSEARVCQLLAGARRRLRAALDAHFPGLAEEWSCSPASK